MKNTRRRILALLLCVLMATSVAMTACTPQDGPGSTPPASSSSTEPSQPGPEAAQLTFVLKTQNGTFVPGAKLILQETNGNPPTEAWTCPVEGCGAQNSANIPVCSKCSEIYLITKSHEAVTDAQGTAVFQLPEVGLEYEYTEYKLLVEDLPEHHVGGTGSYRVYAGEKKTVDINIIDNTPDGTPEYAYFVGAQSVAKPFEAGQTIYFKAFGGVGRKIVIENVNAELELLGEIYQPDANGVVAAYITGVDAEAHVTFGIKNTAADAQQMSVRIDSDPGTSDNPLPIVPGTQITTAQIPAERIHYYRWIATTDGSVTVGPVDATVGSLSIVRNRTEIGEDGQEITTSTATDYTNAENATVTMDFKAGDVIIIRVAVIGGKAGEVAFTFNYTEES